MNEARSLAPLTRLTSRKPPGDTADDHISRTCGRFLWALVVTGLVGTSVVILPGAQNGFRLPKDLLMLAEGIAVACGWLVLVVLTGAWFRVRISDLRIAVPACILLWGLVTTVASRNVPLSLHSLLNLSAQLVIFVTTSLLIQRKPISALYWALVPATVNAILGWLQAFEIWNPLLAPVDERRYRISGLLGGPHDVADLLVFSTLAALALCIVARKRRTMHVAMVVVMGGCILLTETLSAVLALLAGLVTLGFLISKRAVGVAVLIAPLMAFALPFHTLQARITETALTASRAEYDKLLSWRLTAFAAAWEMGISHPVVGVGPGVFPWQYFETKLLVEEKHPLLLQSSMRTRTFSEVHNDHLELFAETGLPGYALFIVSLALLVRISFSNKSTETNSDELRFAKLFAFPLASSLFFLSVGSFPLQLSAVTNSLGFFVAACLGWRSNVEAR